MPGAGGRSRWRIRCGGRESPVGVQRVEGERWRRAGSSAVGVCVGMHDDHPFCRGSSAARLWPKARDEGRSHKWLALGVPRRVFAADVMTGEGLTAHIALHLSEELAPGFGAKLGAPTGPCTRGRELARELLITPPMAGPSQTSVPTASSFSRCARQPRGFPRRSPSASSLRRRASISKPLSR
jgi:hypothetical protein